MPIKNSVLINIWTMTLACVTTALVWQFSHKSLHEQAGMPIDQNSFDIAGRVSILILFGIPFVRYAQQVIAESEARPLPVFADQPRARPVFLARPAAAQAQAQPQAVLRIEPARIEENSTLHHPAAGA